MTEYGLIAALIAMVALPALVLLSGNVNGLLGNLFSGDPPAIVNGNPNNGNNNNASGGNPNGAPNGNNGGNPGGQNNNGAGNGAGNSGNGQIPAPLQGQFQACFLNNVCANLPEIKSPTTITSGSNGAEMTLAFAKALEQVAQQIQADPNIDSSLKSRITQLALYGHELGETEHRVAQTCPGNNCDNADNYQLHNTLVQVHQKNNTFATEYYDLMGYLQRNPNALPTGLQKLIDVSASQIKDIASSFPTPPGLCDPTAGCFTPPKVSLQLGHEITRLDSNTICGTGGEDCTRDSYAGG